MELINIKNEINRDNPEDMNKPYITFHLKDNKKCIFSRKEVIEWPHNSGTNNKLDFKVNINYIKENDFLNVIKILKENPADHIQQAKYFEQQEIEKLQDFIWISILIEHLRRSAYEVALNILLTKDGAYNLRHYFRTRSIYNKGLSQELNYGIVKLLEKEMEVKKSTKWLSLKQEYDRNFEEWEKEYQIYYLQFELLEEFTYLSEYERLEGLKNLKAWIEKYSVEWLKLSACKDKLQLPSREVASFLDDLPELEILNLEYLADDLLELFADKLQVLRISRLYLCDCGSTERILAKLSKGLGLNAKISGIGIGISCEQSQKVLNILGRGIANSDSIRHINIYGVHYNKKGENLTKLIQPKPQYLELFAKAKNIEYLRFGDINLEHAQFYLLKFLIGNHTIQGFRINNGRLNSRSYMVIATALKKGNSIKYLNLDNNKISNEGGKCLAQLLQSYPKLQNLSLKHTNLEDETYDQFSYFYSLLDKPTIQIHFGSYVNNDYREFGCEELPIICSKQKNLITDSHFPEEELKQDKGPKMWESIIERERDISHIQKQNLKNSEYEDLSLLPSIKPNLIADSQFPEVELKQDKGTEMWESIIERERDISHIQKHNIKNSEYEDLSLLPSMKTNLLTDSHFPEEKLKQEEVEQPKMWDSSSESDQIQLRNYKEKYTYNLR